MVSHRREHSQEEIKRKLMSIIHELKDPRLQFQMVSIVKIDISKDNSNCKVYVSSLQGMEHTKQIVKILDNASGYIKKSLAKHLRNKYIPNLAFHSTDSIEYGISISNKLDILNRGRTVMKSLKEIAEIVKEKNNFYILCHSNPDGDTLGSAYALCRGLQKLNKNAKVLCSDKIPEKYKFFEKYVKKQDFLPEYVVTVDVGDTNLLGNKLKYLENRIDLCIDHHISNKKYAKISYIEPTAAAAEILYYFIKELGIEIDREIAECLYVGISTDTGCFEYTNTTAQTHEIVADLMKNYMSIERLNPILFGNKPKNLVKLQCKIYNTLEYHFVDSCALIYVSLDMLNKYGLSYNELEDIASFPQKIEGVRVGLTVKEKAENVYRVSVRTDGSVSAIDICQRFDGGGHKQVGGCEIQGNLDEVKSKILKSVKENLR